MSIMYIDSFDGYVGTEVTQYWTSQGIIGPPTVNTNSQRTGASCLQPSAGGVTAGPWLSGGNSWYTGIGVFVQGLPVSANSFPIYEFIFSTSIATDTPTGLYIGSDLNLYITNAFGQIIASSTITPLRLEQWFFVEWVGAIGAVAHHQLFVDGGPVFDGTLNTISTQSPAIGSYSTVQIGRGGGLFDDFYFGQTGANLGDSSVFAQIPSGTGSFSQWTPHGAGTNWENVETIPLNTASWNEADSSGLKDAYTCAVIRGSGSGVNDYTPSALANSDLVPATQLVQRVSQGVESGIKVEPFLVVAGATYTDGGDAWIPSLFSPQETLYTTAPTTGDPWTGTSVNATQWGIEHV